MPRVTVVPADKLILVDGQGLTFDFSAPSNLHALQWDGQQGHLEFEDDYNQTLSASDPAAYDEEVAPYVALWQAEKDRIAAEEAAAEAARLSEYNSSEACFSRLRTARDTKLTATDKYLLPDYPISADDLTAVKTYRQALRDLPAADGAPWDGGGDATPWPEAPTVAAE